MLVILLLCPDPPSTLVPCSVSPEPEHMTELSELILVFLLSPIFLALMKGAVGRRGFPNIENRPVSYPLAQTMALFLHVNTCVWFPFSRNCFDIFSCPTSSQYFQTISNPGPFSVWLATCPFSAWCKVQERMPFSYIPRSHMEMGVYCSVHCGGSSVCV